MMNYKENVSKSVQRAYLINKKNIFLRTYNIEQSQSMAKEFFSFFVSVPEIMDLKNFISFQSLYDEPDISLINNYLSANNRKVSLISASPDATEPSYTDIDAIIVPMQGFDRLGGRMGRGKGWYDKFLAKVRKNRPDCIKIGICFSFLELPGLITCPHDIAMNIIVTEKEVIRIK